MRHVENDSTIIWAIGPDSGIIAKHAECSGEEVGLCIPFEGVNSGEVRIKIIILLFSTCPKIREFHSLYLIISFCS